MEKDGKENLFKAKSGKIQSPCIKQKILPVPTPLRQNRTPALNACFTPSSLLRRAPFKTTPIKDSPLKKIQKINKSGQHIKLTDCVDDRLVVAVRIRPFTIKEKQEAATINVVESTEKEIKILASSQDGSSEFIHTFCYDYVFNSNDPTAERYATQDEVFRKIAFPLIERVFEGYNACLFAYGQTGSGKSYSMMGINTYDYSQPDDVTLKAEAGIIPRFCNQLFQHIKENNIQAEIEISFCEIYNEKIHDLLTFSGHLYDEKEKRVALKTREHPVWGPYVVGLSVHPVNSYKALRNWLVVGNSRRATVSTRHNDESSRSHSILNIILNTTLKDKVKAGVTTRRSKISLVDLAGSERTSGSGGARLREGVSINKSLLTLGKVISSLSDSNSCTPGHIPYRESVLTWLLKENLGGNSKTVMLATISPANVHVEETLATLRYACQAGKIVNRVKVNESEQDKIIRELRTEVEKLKLLHEHSINQSLEKDNNNDIQIIDNRSEIESLREQLAEREQELKNTQKTWMERLKEAENLRESELRLLKRKGLALEITNEQKQGYLVNLSEDPILSGTLFYILPLGSVRIGRTRTENQSSQPDIVLDGPLIGYNHCMIENDNGNLFIIPENKTFDTYLNGVLLSDKTEMLNGDRLILGGSHYFRILKPGCKTQSNKKLVDFQLAYNEILEKQEEKLRLELEKEKRAALMSMESERFENERDLKERIQQLEMERIMLKCHEEIRESEQNVVSSTNAENDVQLGEAALSTQHKQQFLDKIKRIMKGPCQHSLHKIQLMIKEATQYASESELDYVFKYTQIMDEYGIFHPKILIIDKKHNVMARWPLARLEVWLDIMRNMETSIQDKPFNYVDIEWEPIKGNLKQKLNDALNSSSISLNASVSSETSLMRERNEIETKLSPNSVIERNVANFHLHSTTYLEGIECNVIKLRKLCQQYTNSRDVTLNENVMDLINNLEHSLNLVKSNLCMDTNNICKLTKTLPS